MISEKDIFTKGQCLTDHQFSAYADGLLKGKEANAVERHLLNCDLCNEAMTGLLMLKESGRNVGAAIEENKGRIDKRVEEQPKQSKRFPLWLAAASICGVGLLVYFLNQGMQTSKAPLAQTELAKKSEEEVIPHLSEQEPSAVGGAPKDKNTVKVDKEFKDTPVPVKSNNPVHQQQQTSQARVQNEKDELFKKEAQQDLALADELVYKDQVEEEVIAVIEKEELNELAVNEKLNQAPVAIGSSTAMDAEDSFANDERLFAESKNEEEYEKKRMSKKGVEQTYPALPARGSGNYTEQNFTTEEISLDQEPFTLHVYDLDPVSYKYVLQIFRKGQDKTLKVWRSKNKITWSVNDNVLSVDSGKKEEYIFDSSTQKLKKK